MAVDSDRDRCRRCIAFCSNVHNSLDLIEFSQQTGVEFGQLLRTAGESVLHFAPAGNYPEDPVVTICGLATSVQAKQYIETQLRTRQSEQREVCLESVYQGRMAVNLSLLIGALKIDELLGGPIRVRIGDRTVSTTTLACEHFGNTEGRYVEIPESLQLTQATCCWSIRGRSTFKKEWWDLSQDCRHRGYLANLIRRFIRSSRSRLLVFLGTSNNRNEQVLNDVLTNQESDGIPMVLSPRQWRSVEASSRQKMVCFFHHPANAGHIYNNCRAKQYRSILYCYYEHRRWDFRIGEYGSVRKNTMADLRDYYSEIERRVKKLAML